MKKFILLVTVIFGLPATVSASEAGALSFERSDFYIGIGHGSGNLSTPHRNYDSCPSGFGTRPVAVRGGGVKSDIKISELHVGYDLNPFVSLELGYANPISGFANDPRTSACATSFVALNSRTKIDTKTASLTALIKYPINNDFSVYGLLSYDHLHVVNKRYGGRFPQRSSESFDDIGYGAGLEWSFSEDFTAKLQWKKTNTDHRSNSLALSDTRLIFEMSLN